MDYSKHYTLLMDKAQGRILDGYVERHHIIPRCMGGDNSSSNIAILTPEEHFLAHQLLVKMYPENTKLAFAASAMCMSNTTTKRNNNKLFGWLRRAFGEAMKTHVRKPRKKETKPRPPRTLTEEHKKKIGESTRGKTHTKETKDKMSKSHFGIEHSEETKKKLSAAHSGKKMSDESKQKMSALRKGKPLNVPIVTCPHCGKSGVKGNMVRYHFDKCELIPNTNPELI